MTPAFSARRRADEFEALLSRGPGAPLTERDAERFAALLDLVADLRSLPEVAPRAEFVSSLRVQPFIIANGREDGWIFPTHLTTMGFYVLRVRSNMVEISNVLAQ